MKLINTVLMVSLVAKDLQGVKKEICIISYKMELFIQLLSRGMTDKLIIPREAKGLPRDCIG